MPTSLLLNAMPTSPLHYARFPQRWVRIGISVPKNFRTLPLLILCYSPLFTWSSEQRHLQLHFCHVNHHREVHIPHETIWRLQLDGLWHRPLSVCFRTNKRQEPLHWKSFLVPPVVCCSSFLSSRMQSPWSQNGSSPHWWTHGSLEVAACQIVRSMESGQDKPCPKLGASLQRQKHWVFLRRGPVSGQLKTIIYSNPGKNSCCCASETITTFSHPNPSHSNEFESLMGIKSKSNGWREPTTLS